MTYVSIFAKLKIYGTNVCSMKSVLTPDHTRAADTETKIPAHVLCNEHQTTH